jgi:hypothetical protein
VITSLLADAVVLVHLAFIVFVMAGALLALRWRWVAWLHLPAAAWGAYVELAGKICPLTPLELALRAKAGEAGYETSFIDHYLVPVIYPAELTPAVQRASGLLVLAVNLALYGVVLARAGRTRRSE